MSGFVRSTLQVLLVFGLSAGFAAAEDEHDIYILENNIYVPPQDLKVLDHSERYQAGQNMLDVPTTGDGEFQPQSELGGGNLCQGEGGQENECRERAEHRHDNCTQTQTGPVCKTETRTCAMPGGNSTTFDVNFCCDFGEDGKQLCGCNKEIKSPGKCAGDPDRCLYCLIEDEIGPFGGEAACTACVKQQIVDALAKGNAKDYCELATSFGGKFAYSGAGACLCNTQMPDGKKAKYCKCCTEGSQLSPEDEKKLRDGMKKQCSRRGINQFRGEGGKPPKRQKRGAPRGVLEECPEVPVPGCTKVKFYAC